MLLLWSSMGSISHLKCNFMEFPGEKNPDIFNSRKDKVSGAFEKGKYGKSA